MRHKAIYSNSFTFGYDKSHLFNRAKICIYKGERIQLTGGNGAGKTSLLRLIVGSLQPDYGTISVSGKIFHLLGPLGGFYPFYTLRQNLLLLKFKLTALEDVRYKDFVQNFLDFAMLDKCKLDVRLESLSTGEKMRLPLFSLLNSDADIYIFDEFIGGLDEDFLSRREKIINDKIDRVSTLVLASHNLGFSQRFRCELLPLSSLINRIPG